MRAAWLLLTLTLLGCTVRVRPVTLVEIEPPGEAPEATPRPRAGYLWIRGRWEYRGERWAWRSGEWVKVRRGYVWRDGEWERHGSRWHWVEGHWRGEPSDASSNTTAQR